MSFRPVLVAGCGYCTEPPIQQCNKNTQLDVMQHERRLPPPADAEEESLGLLVGNEGVTKMHLEYTQASVLEKDLDGGWQERTQEPTSQMTSNAATVKPRSNDDFWQTCYP